MQWILMALPLKYICHLPISHPPSFHWNLSSLWITIVYGATGDLSPMHTPPQFYTWAPSTLLLSYPQLAILPLCFSSNALGILLHHYLCTCTSLCGDCLPLGSHMVPSNTFFKCLLLVRPYFIIFSMRPSQITSFKRAATNPYPLPCFISSPRHLSISKIHILFIYAVLPKLSSRKAEISFCFVFVFTSVSRDYNKSCNIEHNQFKDILWVNE